MLKSFVKFLLLTALVTVSKAQTIVYPGDGTLGAAIDSASSGDVLQLVSGGIYETSSSASYTIDKPITIQVEPGAEEKAIIKLSDNADAGSKYYFFTLLDGASLTLKGLDITGLVKGEALGMSMILFDGSPDPAQARIGTIRIDNCEFHDFKDNIFHGMKAAMQTKMQQDSLIINNVLVYNADSFIQYKHPSLHYFKMTNSTIFNLRSMALKIGKEYSYRLTKITPLGFIDHCTLDNMGGDHGHIQIDNAYFPFVISNCIISNIQKENIQPAVFMNEPKIDTAVTIINTCFWKSGRPYSLSEPHWPKYFFEDSITVNPDYQDAANGNFALPHNSLLVTYATDGTQVGDPRWGTYNQTGVKFSGSETPTEFVINQNYPNPFNPATTITFGLPERAEVSVFIYNTMGQQISVLRNDVSMSAGFQNVFWNTDENQAVHIGSGLYFCRILALGESGKKYNQTIKMVYLK